MEALLFWFFGGFGLGVWLFIVLLLDLKIEKWVKWMFSNRLAGDNLFGKWLFTWLSVVLTLMSYLCYFFPEMSLERSGTELSQFLRVFLPIL